jgi:hypothetical protein
VNVLVTALIVYRIMTVYNDIRDFDTSNARASAHGNNLNTLVSILVESGLMTFVGQLTQSIMYKSANTAFPLVSGTVVMLYVRASCRLLIWCLLNFIHLLTQGISSTAVLVRVETGVSYDQFTTKTVKSTNTVHLLSPRQTAIYVKCPSDHDI